MKVPRGMKRGGGSRSRPHFTVAVTRPDGRVVYPYADYTTPERAETLRAYLAATAPEQGPFRVVPSLPLWGER